MAFVVTTLVLFGLYFCDPVAYTPLNLRSVMYYADWSIYDGQGVYHPKLIPGDQLTHLNFGFLDFDNAGNIVLTDANAAFQTYFSIEGVSWEGPNAGILPALQDLRTRYPNLRLGVSLGGWSKSGDFPVVARDPTKRDNLVNQVIKFIEYNNFDFIDVDWEYPGAVRGADGNDEGNTNAEPRDGKDFIQLLKDFKTAEGVLATKTGKVYELSVALPGSIGQFEFGAQAYLPDGVTLGVGSTQATPAQIKTASTDYITELFATIDFGNIMTYDFVGSWNSKTGHHAALFTRDSNPSVDTIVSYLLGKTEDSKGNPLTSTLSSGVLSKKIVIGAAFYSQGWVAAADDGPITDLPGLYGTASTGIPQTAYGTFDTLKATYTDLTYHYDEIVQAPYLYKTGGPFITYDSPKSVTAKAAYVKTHNLGGIISWMASQDATTGGEEGGEDTTGQTRNVLTAAIKTGLFDTTPLQEFIIHPDSLGVSAVVAVDSGKFKVDITNDLQITETRATPTGNTPEEINAAAMKDGLWYSSRLSKTVTVPVLYITLKSGVTVGAPSGSLTWSQSGNVVTVNLYTVVDNLLPGGTANIELPATKTRCDLYASDITGIEISKQIYKSGKVTGRVGVTVAYNGPEDTCPSLSPSGALDVGQKPILLRTVRILMVLALLIAGIGAGY